jgi:hypothetical protein
MKSRNPPNLTRWRCGGEAGQEADRSRRRATKALTGGGWGRQRWQIADGERVLAFLVAARAAGKGPSPRLAARPWRRTLSCRGRGSWEVVSGCGAPPPRFVSFGEDWIQMCESVDTSPDVWAAYFFLKQGQLIDVIRTGQFGLIANHTRII